MDTSTTTPLLDSPVAPPQPNPSRRRSSRLRRVATVALGFGALLVLVVAGAVFWALDRYVIDHVEIADVAVYEAAAVGDAALPGGTTEATDTTVVIESTEPSGEASGAVVTASGYSDADTSIDVSTVVVGSARETVAYHVAEVVVSDGTQVRAGFANNQFGTSIIADTSDIAEYYDAVFAINGDYYGFRDTGIVIRNGVVYRDAGARVGLAVYTDGTMLV